MNTAHTTGVIQITANVIRNTCSSTRWGVSALLTPTTRDGLRGRAHFRFSPKAFTTKIVIGMIEIVSRITAIAEP